MRGDFQRYKRAAGLSILGMVLQLALAAALVVYGLMSVRDTTASWAAAFAVSGAVVWLILAIVYDQHRRERLEALEAETVAGERGGTSVFESRGEEFKVAGKRLAGMYRWLLPVVAIALAGFLIGVGAWRFGVELGVVRPTEPGKPLPDVSSIREGWGMGVGLAVAFVGFIFARYASGMAKQVEWRNLRAGAAFSVGTALLGLCVAVANFVDYLGPDLMMRWLHPIVPGFMVLIGIEIVLNLLLDVYRPRKAGETPAPAFDSRLLGFLAAPDRVAKSVSDAINYQLGFDVTGGWFYKLLSRVFWPLVGAAVVVLWGLTSLAVVQPHQKGTILRWGRPVRENIGPGLHVKLPWPIDSVYIPEYIKVEKTGRWVVADLTATGVRTLQLATDTPATPEALMWTNDHVGTEVFQLVQATRGGGGGGISDLALVSVEVPLQYAVDDVAKFDRLAPPEFRDDLLRAVAQREITIFFQTVSLDDVLGAGRQAVSDKLRNQVEAAFGRLNVDSSGKAQGAGIRVLGCAIVGVHPPKDRDVAGSFEKVLEAQQRYRARVDSAEGERIKALTAAAGSVEGGQRVIAALDRTQDDGLSPQEQLARQAQVDEEVDKAGGYAAQAVARARAERWRLHMQARGRAQRQVGQQAVYAASPDLFRASEYFAALREAVRGARVYITSVDLPDPRLNIDLIDRETGAQFFRPSEEKQ